MKKRKPAAAARPKRARAPSLSPVEVEWEDACQSSGWGRPPDPRDALERMVVRSRGFLVHDDRHHVVVAQSVASNGQLADVLTIPRGCIRRMKRAR